MPDDIDDNNEKSEALLLKMSPNPYAGSGTIRFSTNGGFTMVQQIDALGRVVKVHTKQVYEAGAYSISINNDGLPAGGYFLRLQNGSLQKVIGIIKAR